MTWFIQQDSIEFTEKLDKVFDTYKEYKDAKRDAVVRHLTSRPNMTKVVSFRIRDKFHASGIYDMCERHEFFKRVIPVMAYEDYDGPMFDIWAVGHAVHGYYQNNIFGKTRKIFGDWKCSRCLHVEKGYMPNDVCPKCRWKYRVMLCVCGNYLCHVSDAGKEVVCKKCGLVNTAAAKGELSCSAKGVCRWPGGYQAEGRDCAQCELGGRWSYRERHVEIEEYGLVGNLDGMFIDHEGIESVLDIKTINPKDYPKLEAPSEPYIFQVNMYMWATGIRRAYILYINKHNAYMKAFKVEYDSEIVGIAKKKITNVMKAVQDLDPPMGCCEHMYEERAKACEYREVCFKEAVDLKAHLEKITGRIKKSDIIEV